MKGNEGANSARGIAAESPEVHVLNIRTADLKIATMAANMWYALRTKL